MKYFFLLNINIYIIINYQFYNKYIIIIIIRLKIYQYKLILFY